MSYLITQTFLLLLAAALLGMLLGWYLTRISALSARDALRSHLRTTEDKLRDARTALDQANAARAASERERDTLRASLTSTEGELSALRDAPPASNAEELSQLQSQLATCEAALARMSANAEAASNAAVVAPAAVMSEQATAVSPPLLLDADSTSVDDLQRIKGIGPKIAELLREMGIVRFEQIAEWTPENVAWVNERLKFKGRIERESWIPQARALLDAPG